MTEKTTPQSPTRREFFKTASLGTAAAAGIAAGVVSPAPVVAAQTADTGAGYRETEHVKRYYDLAKKF
jgi:hypothetical protein